MRGPAAGAMGNQQSERGMRFRAIPPLAQPLLVRGQLHQSQVAPDLALGQPVGGQMLAALRLDAVQRGAAPGHAPGHGLEHLGVHAFVAFGVVAHAGRRVQVDGLERAHEGPAQRQTVADAGVHVLDAGVAIGHQPERLVQQRALQPVDDEAVDLAPHHDGLLAGLGQQAARALDAGGVGPGRRHDFHGRDQIRWIDRMRHQATRAARQVGREMRRQQRRGRAGQDRASRRQAIQLGIDATLAVQPFGRAFLHVVGVPQRVLHAPDGLQRRQQLVHRAPAQQARLRQARRHLAREGQRLPDLRGLAVPQADTVPAARIHQGPCPADQARADDCHIRHAALSAARAA